MTAEEFAHWIEDTEGSVCLECGKGGIKADADTGLCPACAAKAVPVPNDNEEFDRQWQIVEVLLDTLSYPGDWPEDRSHENGDYFCSCSMCGATFRGHMRRVACKRCADGTTRTVATIDQQML